MRFLSLLALLSLLVTVTPATAEPHDRPVDLHKRTKVVAYVVPDLGVRFTFPFILDEQDSYVPFTLTGTNPLFVSKRDTGRNYFVVIPDKNSPDGMLGDFFITVAGYEITIEMHTTRDLSKQATDVVFQMTPEAREELIQQSIRQRTAALEQEYKKKFEDLDNAAEKKAIAHVGRLATKKPETSNIKEESRLKLPSGDSVVLYVESVVNYDPYSIYLFYIEADSGSKGLNIMDAKLFSVDSETKQVKPLDAFKDVPQRIQPSQEVQGSISVLGSALNPKDLLRLQIVTDKGTVEAQW